MAKPFLEERGLKLVAFEERHILPFANNLSAENVREFEVLYAGSPVESLRSCLERPLVFTVEKDGQPLAVTGLVMTTGHAQMWALFSKDLRKHWISFARASQKLIQFYHLMHPKVVADVWTENEMIHQWLVHLGFLPEAAIEGSGGHMIIRFVRCTDEQKSAQTATLRPVLH
jgi:hypothetical protein